MEMEITVRGEPYEDRESLRIFSNSLDIYHVLIETQDYVHGQLRSLRDCEEENDALESMLEELAEMLRIPALDD